MGNDLKGKYIFGMAKLGEKGQILIPKEAREVFGLKPGDKLLMLGDEERGIALIKVDAAMMADMMARIPEISDDATHALRGEDEGGAK